MPPIMLATPHTLMGVLIATKVTNPLLAFPLALLSHFVLDLTPHWDFFTFRKKITTSIKIKVVLDFLVALSCGLFFTARALPNRAQAANIFFSCFLANLPDGLEAPYIFLGKEWPFIMRVIKFQSEHHARLRFPWGLLTQLILVTACLTLLAL